eukprot:g15849.t1
MELFVATAETGSFSGAGRLYGLSPASVSRHVNDLEAALGVALLHRSTRALGLTEGGETYLRDARDILASVKAADTAASARLDHVGGVLRVHSRTMFGVSVLAKLQPAFQRLYPDLVVDLHLSERQVRLREDGFDLDFRIAPPQESGLIRRRLFESRRILVAAPAYLDSAPPLVYWRFRDGQQEEEIHIPTAFSSNNGLVLLEMVRNGRGLALLDEYTVAEDIAKGDLVELLPHLRITNATFEEGIFATYLQTPFVPAKLRHYLDFVSANWARVRGGGRVQG